MTEEKKEEQAVATINTAPGGVVALRSDMTDRAVTIIKENVATLSHVSKLDQIKNPASGTQVWSLQAVDGEYAAKTFKAVIAMSLMARRYYETSYDENPNQPPTCQSYDCIEGIGNPGGYCEECPMNEWHKGEPGKACREERKLIIMRTNSLVPAVLNIPVTSIENLNRYIQRIAGGGFRADGTEQPPMMYHHVVTTFGLEPAVSKKGQKYTRMTFTMDSPLPDEAKADMDKIVAALVPVIDKLNQPPTEED